MRKVQLEPGAGAVRCALGMLYAASGGSKTPNDSWLDSRRGTYERIRCLRGDAENRLKEPKSGLGLDRTSCHRSLAN